MVTGLFPLLAVALALLALAFVVFPLWRGARSLAIVLVLVLPMAAGAVYWMTGNPRAVGADAIVAQVEPATFEEAMAQLRARLAAQPDDGEGWALLARASMAAGEFAKASDAYARASELQPGNLELLVEHAEALLRSSPARNFPPSAVLLLDRVLQTEPLNQRALFFLGMHQLKSNHPDQAAATWRKLLPLLNAGAAAALRPQVESALEAAGLPPLSPSEASSTAEQHGLSLLIDVAPGFARRVEPGDTLFVFARELDGRGPPLAAKRIILDALPLRVTLDDADSPMPAARLSSRQTVRVMARLSKSGDAKVGSGDLESNAVEVSTTGSNDVELTLERAIP